MISDYKVFLVLLTYILAFWLLEATDHSEEWKESHDLMAAQQKEQAKKARNSMALEICGPGADSDWEDSTLTCTPKRGKPYQIVIE